MSGSWILCIVDFCSFLGSFAKLLKANIGFVMSVFSSVSLFIRPHGTTGLPLDWFSWYLVFEDFKKIRRKKFKFRKNLTEIKFTVPEDLFALIMPHRILLNENFFQTNDVEKIKLHTLFSNLFSKNRAVCEIIRKNIVEPDRPQMTIWRIQIVCCIPKATSTHSEYVIFVFPLQQW